MLEVIIFHLARALERCDGLSWSVNSHGYFVKYELFLSQPSVIFVRRLQCAGTWLYTHLQAARAVRRVDSRLALGLGSAHGWRRRTWTCTHARGPNGALSPLAARSATRVARTNIARVPGARAAASCLAAARAAAPHAPRGSPEALESTPVGTLGGAHRRRVLIARLAARRPPTSHAAVIIVL